MLTGTLGLLLAGTLLLLVGGYAYGNATMVELQRQSPAVAAAVRRQRRFYVGCMVLAGLGVLLMCGGIGLFAMAGTEVGWPVLAGAGIFAAAGALASVCGAWRMLG